MAALTETIRQQILDLIPRYAEKRAVTLPALHLVQDAQRAVSAEAMVEIAELLEIHPSEVYDTMSFYGFFRDSDNPLGKNRVWVCRSLSCAMRGGEELLAGLCERLKVHPGETTADGKITLEFAECLGACEGAPCILVNDDCHVNLDEGSVMQVLEKL